MIVIHDENVNAVDQWGHGDPRASTICSATSSPTPMASTVEKHIELVIGRRFKGRGMRWTLAGANRLFKLRLRQLQKLM